MRIDEKKIVEVLIFTSPEPIKDSVLAKVASIKRERVAGVIDELNAEYRRTGRTFQIKRVAGGYSMFSLPDFAEYIDEAFPDKSYPKLTRSAIEVLAIIAMEQPVTKKYIDKIRGTNCDMQIKKLMSLGFITPVSRLETPGRPYLMGTTIKFLKHFGLSKVEDIPKLEELAELLD